jgi:hypothetical protein
MREENIRAAIGSLGYASRPAAIVRRVVTIVVLAVNGHAFRFRPHVGKEVRKSFGSEPSRANLDASAAVGCVCMVM